LKVSDQDGPTQQVKRNDENIRRKIMSQNRELEKLENFYEKQKNEIQSEGSQVALETREKNDQLLLKESHRYQNELNKYRDNIKNIQNQLTNEKQTLQTNHKDNVSTLNEQYLSDHQAKTEEIEDKMLDDKEWASDTINDIEKNYKQVVSKNQLETQKGINAISARNDIMSRDTDTRFQEIEKNKLNNFESKMRFLDSQNRVQMENDLHKFHRMQTEQQKIFDQKKQFAEKHQTELVKSQQELFAKRLQGMSFEHDSVASRIKDLHAKDLKSLIDANAKIKNDITVKSEDEFYQLSKLDPFINEYEKFYTVSIPIPPHEKDEIQLMANERKIRVTLSRRNFVELEEPDGSKSKTKRSEVLSREFNTTDILNPKDISKSYEDGLLTYKIAKK